MSADSISTILSHFPELTARQVEQFGQLGALYADWNAKINVVSRKDMEFFYERHVLHSLAIAKAITFEPGGQILDAGTGGGFPGIPLAILFPGTSFTLADSIGKKIKVVEAVSEALGLQNVSPVWQRAEQCPKSFHFIISRAVASLADFLPLVRNLVVPGSHSGFRHGLFYLRGDLDHEILSQYKGSRVYHLSELFYQPFFETKKLVYIPLVK